MSSCDVVEFAQTAAEDRASLIVEPTTLPASEVELEQAFHGGDTRIWQTISFSFANIDGLQECRLDDQMTINADGTYEYDGGNTLCNGADNQRNKTGTWEITNQGKNILFNAGRQDEYLADVTGFDDDLLAISGQYMGLTIRGIFQMK